MPAIKLGVINLTGRGYAIVSV